MEQVTLGKTGICVNKNGFGALPIQRISDEEAVLLLRKACDNGITFLIRPVPIRTANISWGWHFTTDGMTQFMFPPKQLRAHPKDFGRIWRPPLRSCREIILICTSFIIRLSVRSREMEAVCMNACWRPRSRER